MDPHGSNPPMTCAQAYHIMTHPLSSLGDHDAAHQHVLSCTDHDCSWCPSIRRLLNAKHYRTLSDKNP